MHYRMTSPIDFDWNQMRALLATADTGSFSKAAQALQVTQPTVGRQVAALEESLGVALLERVGNRMELTSAGRDIVAHARAMKAAALQIAVTAEQQSETLEGTVRITASQAVSAYLLPPVVQQLRATYPSIRLDVVVSNALQDLRRRDADIAIRNVRPADPSLRAVKLGDAWARFYASRTHIEQRCDDEGVVSSDRLEIFAFDDSSVMIDGLRGLGLTLTDANFPLVVPDHLVQWQMARDGLGICVMMEQVGDADPDVERVDVGVEAAVPVPLWLVAHRELLTSRRMRVVFDALREALQQPTASSPRSPT